MNNTDFIVTYVQTCASGKLGLSDCGPVWQLGVIAVFLVIAVVTLAAMRFRAYAEPEKP